MLREEAESYLHKKVQDGKQISPVLSEGIKTIESVSEGNNLRRDSILRSK